MLFLIVILAGGFTGCSSTNKAYYDTIQLALADNDVSLSLAEVQASKADLMQVTRGQRDTVVLALAFIESELYKWVSADHALLVAHHGVVTETQGLEHDLLYVSELEANPFKTNQFFAQWNYRVDILGLGYGLPVQTQWRVDGEQTLNVLEHELAVIHVVQDVTFPRTSPFWESGLSWQNEYWIDSNTKQLLRSTQKLFPDSEWLDMVYLSRAARLIASSEGEE
ncbi:YjbF family lipoprotein [Alteromonas aestuariivivens]|uniref:YjbF family lipoprotein n=1 Tax=Alteromonas aestuariivivens TaxID=1938339 RepID=UPI001FE7FF0B|nr:YjbF family lipoprotein [Alteromonas aestuariivivens]